jgi:hypothetical protein
MPFHDAPLMSKARFNKNLGCRWRQPEEDELTLLL